MATRESKFDILRLLSMYMIICGHLIYHGIRHILSPEIADVGFSDTLTGQVNFFLCQFLGYVCNVGSNLFIMITGYFLIQPRPLRYVLEKGLKLWFTIIFYCLVIYGITVICHQSFEPQVFFQQITPIYSSNYWFMTMYMGILLLSPFMARMAGALTKKEYQILLLILLFMNFSQEEYGYGTVYSSTLFFFMFIFLIGGYIRLHRPSNKLFKYAGWLFLFICLVLALTSTINQVVFNSTSFLQIRGLVNNSIPIFTSVCLFLWFYSLPLKESAFGKLAINASPYILSVYLIHDNTFVRSALWDEIVRPTLFINEWFLIPYILIVSVLIMLVCVLIDMIRKHLEQFVRKTIRF